jgi:hypothetical protein
MIEHRHQVDGIAIAACALAQAADTAVVAFERALFDFIEGFYNSRRRHSALDYLSPAEHEQTQAWAA